MTQLPVGSYAFQVAAVNAGGMSEFSETVYLSIRPPAAPTPPPTVTGSPSCYPNGQCLVEGTHMCAHAHTYTHMHPKGGTATCSCFKGWSGSSCSVPPPTPQSCDLNCEPNGQCLVVGGDAVAGGQPEPRCLCFQGWVGSTCSDWDVWKTTVMILGAVASCLSLLLGIYKCFEICKPRCLETDHEEQMLANLN